MSQSSLTVPTAPPDAGCRLRIVLINPYELGRQPFGLAQPAAWLVESGHEVRCLDLSLQRLDNPFLRDADLVAIYLGMHTATRIACAALPRVRELAPNAYVCAFGLYAPMNEALLRSLGVSAIFGGEVEPELNELAQRLCDGSVGSLPVQVSRARIDFRVPDRSELPSLGQYAHLALGNGETRVVGFAEASRGCKHLCRHCPVVPVYEGKFRIVPVGIVMSDIRNQVAAGAQHISFGDPDFLNGPTHALRVVDALHEEFPGISYDATIKVEHILAHASALQTLRDTGCLFVTSAVESVDDEVLGFLAKNHTAEDFRRIAHLLRDRGIGLAPTFVPFTPWTTLQSYVALLRELVQLELVESVPPIQLAIRLLVPQGSYLLRLPGFSQLIDEYDDAMLGFPWRHRDPRVDTLHASVQALVCDAEAAGTTRRETFSEIWSLANRALGRPAPSLPKTLGQSIPHMSEPWYCCAEPTDQQLQSF